MTGRLVHDHQHSTVDIIDFGNEPPSPISGTQVVTRRVFDVSFDDEGFDDPNTGVVLWTPLPTEIILAAWARLIERFEGADTALLYLGGNVNFDQLIADPVDLVAVGDPPDPSQDFLNAPGSLVNQTLDAAQSSLGIAVDGESVTRSLQRVPTEVGVNGTSVIVAATITNGPLTAGALRVIAITVVPA